MAALSGDIKIIRYGVVDAHTPITRCITASATVYRGSVAATRSGYLVAASSPQSTDVVVGIVAGYGPGNADVSPGVVGGTTNSSVTAEIATGTFLLASGTGSDALDVTTNGTAVYLMNENTVGKTNGSNTRPVAGIQVACATDDPTIPSGFVAVTLGTTGTFGAI